MVSFLLCVPVFYSLVKLSFWIRTLMMSKYVRNTCYDIEIAHRAMHPAGLRHRIEAILVCLVQWPPPPCQITCEVK